ncbi:MAG: glycosyltransferase family 2 protein [Ruminococcus sp.]|nr:glycosyltransferase family 2 protein [Ruminococcus sp.]
MKYISFAIPSYNSESYMEHAIQSILPAGEDVEILVVNDGSKDRTREIGELYASKYPSIVKVINKENGGHGDAVNYGLMHATGKYFKVVDSDDKVDGESLEKIMDVLKKFERDGREVDMVLSNYVYDKVGKKHKKVMNYRSVIRPNRILDWDKANQLRLGQYILMHSVIYRTEMLKGCKMELPKHTFYVDNIYVYYPLPHVKKFCYVDTDFYLYYIGREDQSVNEKVMIGRLDQQIFVTKTMIDMYHLEEDVQSRKLRHYMRNYLSMMMTISTILCIRSKNAENLEKMRGLWQYLKEQDKVTYRKIRHGLLGILCHLPGRTGRAIGAGIYCVVRKVVGFS